MTLDDDERALRRRTHETIKRVTGDIDPRMHLNTAISALMELVNELYAFGEKRGFRPSGRDDESARVDRPPRDGGRRCARPSRRWSCCCRRSRRISARSCGSGSGTPTGSSRPGGRAYDEAAAREDEIEIPVQVNGKVRGRVTVPAGAERGGHRSGGARSHRRSSRTWPASRS